MSMEKVTEMQPSVFASGGDDVTSSGCGEIDRTASILNAVREINRGVVRGEDFEALMTSAFKTLVTTGILTAAWLYLQKRESSPSRHVAVGWGTSFQNMMEKFHTGWLPGCCLESLRQNTTASVSKLSAFCEGCPLSCSWKTRSERQEETLTTAVHMDEKRIGFISVKVAPSSATRQERRFWLKELVSDIPFVLRNIDLIEKRQLAEQALQKEALRRQVLMGASRDGIAIFNQQHEVVETNQRFAEMLGYTADEALKLHTWDFEAVMTESEIRKGFENLEQISVTFETKHRRKDGSLYDAEVSASGAMVGGEAMIFTVSRDITEKKALQASLVQSDRMAGMGLIAAGVAHEINNPLSYVLYNLETLLADLPGAETEGSARPDMTVCEVDVKDAKAPNSMRDVETLISEAMSGARRIQRITQTLGTFSKANRERVTSVNVAYALECALNMAFNEIKYRARLVTNYGRTPNVLADEGSLSQVFLNLLINAAHAVREGSPEENEIRVSTARVGNEVHVEVSDTGCGISKEHLDRIFEPFFTTKGIGVGSGLGLSISRDIVIAFGGDITVKRSTEKGSVFVVSLPIGEAEDSRISAIPAPNFPNHSVSGRVLVVDDEEGICRALIRMLRRHEVTAVRNGNDAIRIIDEDPNFDVILCDMMMPGLSGMDFHKWLAKRRPDMASRLIFITGGAFTSQTSDYLKTVDAMCIHKPFDTNELLKIIGVRISRLRQ